MKKTNIIFFALFLVFFNSCKSLQQPKNIPEQINYSDEKIIQIEIERIYKYLQSEPVRAFWRACLLKNQKVIDDCKKNLEVQIQKSLEEKDYLNAKKYFYSLKNAGFTSSQITEEKLNELLNQNVFSKKINNKSPKNISDCMKATVTIWIDRGVTIKNGSGFADIVIGSGFFIDENGYLITNYHVIESMVDAKYEGYSRLYIKLLENLDEKIPAKVIGYDSLLDLALLKVEISPEVVLNLGSSSNLKIGDKVSAIGTPIGLEGTLTSGIVSSKGRKLFSMGNVFQIDAAVNSGNSGGPLIDENLNVQAVVFAGMLQFQGLNFAIPIEYLKQELDFMFMRGEIIHPWIGAYGHTKRKGNSKIGLEIQYLLPGGSAKMSGLKVGDVITQINETKINSIEDFQFLMLNYEIENLIKCKYLNENNEEKECFLYLEPRPTNPSVEIYKTDFIEDSFVPLFGMKMIRSSTIMKKSYTIESIINGSVADENNFSQNDNVVVKDIHFDDENKYFFVRLSTKRQKKGFFEFTIFLGTPYDNPYYF